MASTDETPSVIDFNREQQRRLDKRQQREQIQDLLETCSRALEKGEPRHYVWVGERLATELLPMLEVYSGSSIGDLRQDLSVDDGWDDEAVMKFHKNANEALDTLSRPPAAADSVDCRLTGLGDPVRETRRLAKRALDTVAAVAAEEGIVAGAYKAEAEARGFSVKLGVHKQKPDMDFGDPVSAIRRDLGALKHYFTGGTGGGKSNGAGRQFEDYYHARLGAGRDYKCVDLVGLSTENVDAYDLPQQQPALRRAREDHDLAADWTEIDGYEPEAEILIPFSPDLTEYQLPFYEETGEPVADVFTIPAADISPGLLVAYLEADVSDGERRTIKDAYHQVDRTHDDWALEDLAAEIRSRDELSDKDKQSAVRALQTLDAEGFIQTSDHRHALGDDEWRELFHSTDTITVFNQSPLQRKASRYLVISHLIDNLWKRRIRAHDQPNLVAWFREMHSVVPHREIRRKADDTVQNLMEYTVSVMHNIMRLPRDINTHVIADTQDPTDVEKGIRQMFNRYVVFGGNDSDLKDIFSWAGQNNYRSLKGTLSDEPGFAGIVKGCEPAIGDPNSWGMSPVHLTPPSWHHHDKDEGPSGWTKRARISQECDAVEAQSLRYPTDEWGLDSLSSSFDVEEYGQGDEEDAEEQMSDRDYARLQARQLYSMTDKGYRTIAEEIPDNPDTGKSFAHTTVEQWCKDVEKNSRQPVTE